MTKKSKLDKRMKGKLRRRDPQLLTGRCTKCKKKDTPVHPVDDENFKTVMSLCEECFTPWLAGVLAAARRFTEEWKERNALQNRIREAGAAAAAERQRAVLEAQKAVVVAKVKKVKRAVSLAAVGNVPLMKQMLQAGKSDAQILEAFTTMYAAQGKTDEKWITARVNTYKNIAREQM